MNTMTELDLTGDIIAVTDIIERYEALEEMVNGLPDALERRALATILDDLRGNGGDHQWRGDWYPSYLIRDLHFEEYVIKILEDCGTIPKDFPTWVTKTKIDGATYWYRIVLPPLGGD